MKTETTILTELFEYLINDNDYFTLFKKWLDKQGLNIKETAEILADDYFWNIDYLCPNSYLDRIENTARNNQDLSLEELIQFAYQKCVFDYQ